VCSNCDAQKQVWVFEVSARAYANEVANIVSSSSTQASRVYTRPTYLTVDFEIDIQGKIYVTQTKKFLRETYNTGGSITPQHTSPVLGYTGVSNAWPAEYQLDAKIFEITCPGHSAIGVISSANMCPYEGHADAILGFEADISLKPADTPENGVWVQAGSQKVFTYTIRQVYQKSAETLYISLAVPSFQQCTSPIQYVEIFVDGGRNPDYYISCAPACEAIGQNDVCTVKEGVNVYYDEEECEAGGNTGIDRDAVTQNDRLQITKFNGLVADASTAVDYKSSDTALSAVQHWTLDDEDSSVQVVFTTDGYECGGMPNDIKVHISTTPPHSTSTTPLLQPSTSTTPPPPSLVNVTTTFQVELPFETENVRLQEIVALLFETTVENVEINKVTSSRRRVLLLLLEGIVEVTVKHQKTPVPDINSVKSEIERQLQAGTTTTPVFMAAGQNENLVMTYIVMVLGGIVLVLSIAIFIIAKCYNLPCAPCVPCAPCEPCAPCQAHEDGDDDLELTASENTGGHVAADLHMHGQAFDTFFMRTSAHQGCMYKHCAQHIPP